MLGSRQPLEIPRIFRATLALRDQLHRARVVDQPVLLAAPPSPTWPCCVHETAASPSITSSWRHVQDACSSVHYVPFAAWKTMPRECLSLDDAADERTPIYRASTARQSTSEIRALGPIAHCC